MLKRYNSFITKVKKNFEFLKRNELTDFGQLEKTAPILLSIQMTVSEAATVKKLTLDLINTYENEYDRKVRIALSSYFHIDEEIKFSDNPELVHLFVDYRRLFNYLKRNINTVDYEKYSNLKRFVDLKIKSLMQLKNYNTQETIDYLLDFPSDLFDRLRRLNLLNQWNLSFSFVPEESEEGTYIYENISVPKYLDYKIPESSKLVPLLNK